MDESWDITTNLGTTALAVGAQRAAETAQEEPLVRDEFAAVLVAAVNEPGWQTMAQGDLSWMGAEEDIGSALARSILGMCADAWATTTGPMSAHELM
jgi:O-methyltransferase involved in polyketide biosynthesis